MLPRFVFQNVQTPVFEGYYKNIVISYATGNWRTWNRITYNRHFQLQKVTRHSKSVYRKRAPIDQNLSILIWLWTEYRECRMSSHSRYTLSYFQEPEIENSITNSKSIDSFAKNFTDRNHSFIIHLHWR